MIYLVTVEYQAGRIICNETITVSADKPEIAAAKAEWALAMRRDGTCAYVSHYFANKIERI